MRDDEVDDLLRAAMKTLDDQMPSGYFEGLPQQTLARLEDNRMQTTGTGSDVSTSTGQPPQLKQRDEDSGLHDIRELASSQRMRLSSRRIGSTSPPADEDILASTSGSWKAVALPEPAKMISLPELAELPAVIDPPKQAKQETKSERKSRKSGELSAAQAAVLPSQSAPLSIPPAVAAKVDEPAAKPAVTPIIPMQIGSRVAKPQKSNKGVVLGVFGAAVAAAAGVVVYVQTKGDTVENAAMSAPAGEAARAKPGAMSEGAEGKAAAPTAQAIATDAVDKKADEVPAVAAEPSDLGVADPTPPPAKGITKRKPDAKSDGKKPGKQVIEVPGPDTKTPEKPTKKPEVTTGKDKPKDGEPDFDQLLKEAGADNKPKENKPKLERTALSAGDFKKGMAAVQGRAQKCYDGTQGTATVKLTIAPSGQVSKVVVGGQFAGTSVAACIEAAVRGATFPAWDGGPQSMGYSYLLSE